MSYFVRIDDSSEVRRRLLESSKEIITVLKGYQRILDLRDEKKDLTLELHRVLAETNLLLAELEKFMPERSLKELEQYLPKEPKPKVEPKPTPEPKLAPTPKEKKGAKNAKKTPELPKLEPPQEPKKVNELDRLEQALSNIESRLKAL